MNGDGKKERERLRRFKLGETYLYLFKQGLPGGYQTLCRNCHIIKTIEHNDFRKGQVAAGKKLSVVQLRAQKIREYAENYKDFYLTQTKLARIFHVKQPTVSRALRHQKC